MPDAAPADSLQTITIETRKPGRWLFVDLDGHIWRWDGRAFKSASDDDVERIRGLAVRLLSRRVRRKPTVTKAPCGRG